MVVVAAFAVNAFAQNMPVVTPKNTDAPSTEKSTMKAEMKGMKEDIKKGNMQRKENHEGNMEMRGANLDIRQKMLDIDKAERAEVMAKLDQLKTAKTAEERKKITDEIATIKAKYKAQRDALRPTVMQNRESMKENKGKSEEARKMVEEKKSTFTTLKDKFKGLFGKKQPAVVPATPLTPATPAQ